jgi:hypothetical protein
MICHRHNIGSPADWKTPELIGVNLIAAFCFRQNRQLAAVSHPDCRYKTTSTARGRRH